MKKLSPISILLPLALVAVLGYFAVPFFVYGQEGHEMSDNGHMMRQGKQSGTRMEGPSRMRKDQGTSMTPMPRMHQGMSGEEMKQYCKGMTERHQQMQARMRRNTNQLNALVGKMKQMTGNQKIAAMEDVIEELVNQHNERRRMMVSSRPMTGMMIGLHGMDRDQRRMMIRELKSCPFYEEMMAQRENQ